MTELQSTVNDIAFTVSSRGNKLLIRAQSSDSLYEQELACSSYINFLQLQKSISDKNFQIISQTNEIIKIQVGVLSFELKQPGKVNFNEFQETITTLTINLDSEMEKNARLEARTEKLQNEVNQLNSKFAEMAQKILELTQKVLEFGNIKTELNAFREELAKSRVRETELQNKAIELRSTFQSRMKELELKQNELKNGSLSQIGTTTTIDELDIFDLIRRVTDEQQKIFEETNSSEKLQEDEEQKKELPAALLSAFQILTQIPKIAWKDFNHSKIIETQAERETIKSFFGKNIVSMQMLYRASENFFSVRKFHEKCDRIEHTLILCKIAESNKKIGGYTPLKWENPLEVEQKADESEQSFIFSLTNEDKFDLRRKDCAIVNKKHWGPVFGCDLVINDKANQHANCYAKINMCYNNKNYKKDDWFSTEKFVGNKDSSHFKLEEWEVWHIELA